MKSMINTIAPAALLASLLAGAAAEGAIIVSVDADATTPVIDAVRTVTAGDTITVALVLEMTAATDTLSAYGVSLRFDNLELTLDGTAVENDPSAVDSTAGNPMSPFTSGVGSQTDDRSPGGRTGTDDGEVSWFEAAALLGAASGVRSWVIGTVPFEVLVVADDGRIDMTPGFFDLADAMWDGSFSALSPTFVGATLVPEPGETAVAFGLAAAGALLVRRRAGRKA